MAEPTGHTKYDASTHPAVKNAELLALIADMREALLKPRSLLDPALLKRANDILGDKP